MSPTRIEWTDETWNPVTGCDRVSPGCANCYIERTPPFRMEGRRFDENGKMGVRLHPDRLDQPLHWRKPRRVFVNSLSDLFHPDVPQEFVERVFATMAATPQHTYQILTKRPQRMAKLVRADPELDDYYDPGGAWGAGEKPSVWRCVALPNVWLGVSIESDRYTWRADHLRATPAAVRFLSLEPLLGALPSLDLTGIDWVITGGESGPHARPSHPDWFRDVRDRCVAAGVAYFHKQNGEWRPLAGNECAKAGDEWPADTWGQMCRKVGKKASGRLLDGRTWDEMPERVDA